MEVRKVATFSAVASLINSIWIFLVPIIQKNIGFSYSTIGIIFGASFLINLILKIGMGDLADKIGGTFALKLSMVALILANLVLAVAKSPVTFLIANTLRVVSVNFVYWTSIAILEFQRKKVGDLLFLSRTGSLIGFVTATIMLPFLLPQKMFFLFAFVPLIALFIKIKTPKIERHEKDAKKITKKLLLVTAAALFMTFQVAIWNPFFSLFLVEKLGGVNGLSSTGLFFAIDVIAFMFFIYFAARIKQGIKGIELVIVTSLFFTLIIGILPFLTIFLLAFFFFILRNLFVTFRMIGVSEMMGDITNKRNKNFQTQFYAGTAEFGAVMGSLLGGFIAENLGLNYIFYASIPIGLISILLFFIAKIR